jgi:hypothetical protein
MGSVSASAAATAAKSAATAAKPSTRPATAAESAASLTRRIFFRPGFVDGDGLFIERSAVELTDGLFRTLFRRHLHKSEPSGLIGKLIPDDAHGHNLTGLGKVAFQVVLSDFRGQIADIQIFIHDHSLTFALNGYELI